MTSLTTSNNSQHLSQQGYRLGLAVMIVLALLGLGIYLVEGARQVNDFGFPLDDSWIHLQIAHNLASGHGWSYNPGEPTGAATSPLWILLITPLFYLGGDVTIWVKVLGSLLYLASVILVVDVACLATGDRRVGLVAGALAALQPAFIWTAVSGMETGLYLLLFFLSVRSLFLIERARPACRLRQHGLVDPGRLCPAGVMGVVAGTLGISAVATPRAEWASWWVHGGIALRA